MNRSSSGFTLVELMIALTVLSLLSLSLYGTVSLGARTAASGERKSEQGRRARIATSVIVRQLRSAAPLRLITEEEETAQPYFIGEVDRVSFITAVPQSPDATGLAVVDYWYEDGTLMMSEIPYFAAFAGDLFDPKLDHLRFETPLLFDVREVVFEYRRSDFANKNWENKWDAIDEDALPAAVRIEILPDMPDGFNWFHEVPVFVGALNEVTGGEDFRGGRR